MKLIGVFLKYIIGAIIVSNITFFLIREKVFTPQSITDVLKRAPKIMTDAANEMISDEADESVVIEGQVFKKSPDNIYVVNGVPTLYRQKKENSAESKDRASLDPNQNPGPPQSIGETLDTLNKIQTQSTQRAAVMKALADQ